VNAPDALTVRFGYRFQRIPLHVFCDSIKEHRLAFQELFDNVEVREANDQEAEMNEAAYGCNLPEMLSSYTGLS
jgi:hypothetical protein